MKRVLYDTPVGLYIVSYKGVSKTVDKTEDYFVLESPEIVVRYNDISFTFTVSKEMYIRMFSRGVIIIGRKHGHVLYGKNRHDFNGLITGYVEGRKATGGLGVALFIFLNDTRVSYGEPLQLYKIYGEEKEELDSMNLLDISKDYILARDGKWMQVYRPEE